MKLATAPTSDRPRRRRAISAPTSKSSRLDPASSASPQPAGHRRERTRLRRPSVTGVVGCAIVLVDRHAHARLPFASALAQAPPRATAVRAQSRRPCHAGRQLAAPRARAERLAQRGEDRATLHRSSLSAAAPQTAGSARCRRADRVLRRDCRPGRRPRPSRSAPPSSGSETDRARRRRCNLTRRNSRRASGFGQSKSARSVDSARRDVASRPARAAGTAARTAGRSTKLDTGLPGRPMKRPTVARRLAERERLARLHRDLPQVERALRPRPPA